MKNILLVLAAIIVLGGGYMLLKGNAPAEMPKEDTTSAESSMKEPGATGPSGETEDSKEDTVMEKGEVKEFTVEGTPFAFSETEIKVKQGDTVKITFVNKQGMHDWVVDEFSARTKQLQAGSSETISFVADKAGTFEYYCSVGNHRQQGMKGSLIVE